MASLFRTLALSPASTAITTTSSGGGDGRAGGHHAAAAAAAGKDAASGDKPCSGGPQRGKSGKKICCSCPDTRRLRDLCMVEKGQEHCKEFIEAHNACLREEGFKL